MSKLSTLRRRAALAAALTFLLALVALAQGGGGHSLYGDLKVDESKAEGHKPLSYDVILYTEAGNVVGRQPVPAGGRFRFYDLPNGHYSLAVEVEGSEVSRSRIQVISSFKTDFQHDISLGFRARPGAGGGAAGTVSAGAYRRKPAAQKLYE